MYNLTHNEDSSVDIKGKWHEDRVWFQMRHSHDELGQHTFEFSLNDFELLSMIRYFEYMLTHKE